MAIEGARAIAEMLRVNSNLQAIYLDDNWIGIEVARAITEALTVNSKLQCIYLKNNRIGDEGARAIAEAPKSNSALREIFLWKNGIGDYGARTMLRHWILNFHCRRLISITMELDRKPSTHWSSTWRLQESAQPEFSPLYRFIYWSSENRAEQRLNFNNLMLSFLLLSLAKNWTEQVKSRIT